jgi:membrane protein YqaA with SNARE-associated domain
LGAESFSSAINQIMQGYGLLGFTLAAFVSNLIPGFPAVYLTVVVSYTIASPDDLLGLAKLIVAGGVGAGLGKFVEFYLSEVFGSRVGAVREKRRSLSRVLSKTKLGIATLVFLFAALPLPDDVLYIPLGAAGFSKAVFLAAVILGKTALTAITAGMGMAAAKLLEGGLTPAKLAGLAVGTAVITLLIFAVDWERIIEGYTERGWRGAARAFGEELVAVFSRLAQKLAG